MRIISIGDGIDYPTSDDWTAIQFRFLINEMPVTDTSKKVKAVIKHRQEEGKWICAVPYGYVMTNSKLMKFTVDEPSAEIVRKIFQLYADGWGYKKIANYLTDNHIPTPRKSEEMRKEAEGEEFVVRSRQDWSIITISGILTNDFYIGTLRQRKYRRKKINGGDMKLQETDHIVIANNHEPIVDFKLFSVVQEQMKLRSKSNYRGIKKYDNPHHCIHHHPAPLVVAVLTSTGACWRICGHLDRIDWLGHSLSEHYYCKAWRSLLYPDLCLSVCSWHHLL